MSEERKKYHLINELPHIYEMEDMMQFCKKYEHIYIYGRAVQQEYLLKFFDMSDVNIDGFVVSNKKDGDDENFIYRKMPVIEYEDIKERKDTGVILALSDKYYHQIIPKFRKDNFDRYFMMTEYNKRSIAYQVRPRTQEEMTFEVSLVDHCNLSCQMCDHYSQLSDKWFVDMEQFRNDMKRMGEICNHKLAAISLLGGEPTLHPDIIECMQITREQFPDAEIIVLTNGTLLMDMENTPKGNFWQACKELGVHITVTVYPIKLDFIGIEEKAKQYNVPLAMSSDIHAKNLTKIVKISDKHTMDLSKSVEKYMCVNCLYFNKFCVLKDGRIYMCPIEAHCNIFNKKFNKNLEIIDGDYLDIYKINNWEDIANFSCQYVPFCSYCDLKHWGHHSQWKASSKKIEEYV